MKKLLNILSLVIVQDLKIVFLFDIGCHVLTGFIKFILWKTYCSVTKGFGRDSTIDSSFV